MFLEIHDAVISKAPKFKLANTEKDNKLSKQLTKTTETFTSKTEITYFATNNLIQNTHLLKTSLQTAL